MTQSKYHFFGRPKKILCTRFAALHTISWFAYGTKFQYADFPRFEFYGDRT